MILVNGKQTDVLPVMDRGLAYGDGVFETVLYCNQRLQNWDLHMQRMNAGCEILSIPFPGSGLLKGELSAICEDTEQVIKIIVTRGPAQRGYATDPLQDPTRILIGMPRPDYKRQQLNGVKVRICRQRLSEQPVLAGIKHLNRLEQVLARMEWSDDGYTEGVMLDYGGNVVEGTMSNIFGTRDGKLFTPVIDRCGVRGVMRARIMQLAESVDMGVEEIRMSEAELYGLDEMFVCNSVIGILPVIAIDSHALEIGALTRKLQGMMDICR